MSDHIIYKTYTKCKGIFPQSDFPTESRKGKTQRISRCRECYNNYIRAYYHKTKTRRAELRRQRYLSGNKAKYKTLLQVQKIPFTTAWYHYKWRSLYANAKKRGIPFDLVMPDIRQIYKTYGGNCPYCKRPMKRPSVDRKDNKLGYVRGNCLLVCYGCNTKKNAMSKIQILGVYMELFGNKRPSEVGKTLSLRKDSIPLVLIQKVG